MARGNKYLFTREEEVKLIREAQRKGVMPTAKKYNIHFSTLYKMMKRHDLESLEDHQIRNRAKLMGFSEVTNTLIQVFKERGLTYESSINKR